MLDPWQSPPMQPVETAILLSHDEHELRSWMLMDLMTGPVLIFAIDATTHRIGGVTWLKRGGGGPLRIKMLVHV